VPDAPRLAYPFRLTAGGASIVEQDSLDDLASTAWFAIRTPPGRREEAPGFGVADPTFTLNPTPRLVADLERSDPRLVLVATEDRDALILNVRLAISGASE
jgi:hypothetical protein